jgi:hypothetical protein
VTGWDNPYLGFGVHVTAADGVRAYQDRLGLLPAGPLTADDLRAGLERYAALPDGNPLGVLVTCEADPGSSAALAAVMEVVFVPWVQVFYVTAADRQTAGAAETLVASEGCGRRSRVGGPSERAVAAGPVGPPPTTPRITSRYPQGLTRCLGRSRMIPAAAPSTEPGRSALPGTRAAPNRRIPCGVL